MAKRLAHWRGVAGRVCLAYGWALAPYFTSLSADLTFRRTVLEGCIGLGRDVVVSVLVGLTSS